MHSRVALEYIKSFSSSRVRVECSEWILSILLEKDKKIEVSSSSSTVEIQTEEINSKAYTVEVQTEEINSEVEIDNRVEIEEEQQINLSSNSINTSQLSDFSFEGKTIRYDRKTNYINLDDLKAYAPEKRFDHWLENKNTKEFLYLLNQELKLDFQNSGNLEEFKNTSSLWCIKGIKNRYMNKSDLIHPEVAIQLLQWFSPKFRIICGRWLLTLLTRGSVSLSSQERDKYQLQITSLTSEKQKLQLALQQQVVKLNELCQKWEWLYFIRLLKAGTWPASLAKVRLPLGGELSTVERLRSALQQILVKDSILIRRKRLISLSF